MAATPESLVKKRIRKVFEEEGVYYAMPIGTGYGNAGVPDFLCCVGGKFLAIEAKAGKGKTTALQDAHLARIEECGGTALVVNENNISLLPAIVRRMKGTP